MTILLINLDMQTYLNCLETDAQKKAIKDLITNESIAFVTAEEIKKGATNSGVRILPHTFKILPK